MSTKPIPRPSRQALVSLVALVCLLGVTTTDIVPSLMARESDSALKPASASTEAKAPWVTECFGRPAPNVLHWSVDPEVTKAFSPSGVGDQIIRCGDFTVLSNHGLYWSCEESRDTSKDMQASVMIFKGEQRVFVARGYKFLDFTYDAAANTLGFKYWTGINKGDKEIVLMKISLSSGVPQIDTKFLSTESE